MRRKSSRILAVIVALGSLILVGRLAWVICRSETGWGSVFRQCRDAVLVPFVGEYQPLAFREPDEQADFWLAEVDRLVAEDPENAEVAMAAAWFLDAPASDSWFRHVKVESWLAEFGVPPLQPDDNALQAAEETYEAKCGAKCRAMAARATELAPEDRRTWQSRALLLHNSSFRIEVKGRDPAWLQVLDQCARHDPDNALYDYLASQRLWTGTLDCDFSGPEPKWRITDPRRAAEAEERFERGQKNRLAVDEGICPVLAAFLRRSAVPHVDHEKAFHSIYFHPRISFLVADLVRTQWRLTEVRLDSGDDAGARRHLRQADRLLEEVASMPGNVAGEGIIHQLRVMSPEQWQRLVKSHPDLLSPAELAKVNERQRAAVATQEALRKTAAVVNPRLRPVDPVAVVAFAISGSLLPAVVVLLAAALATALITRSLGPPQPGRRPLGTLRHVLAWLVGYGVGIAVLGLAPAQLVPAVVQGWALAGAIALACVVGSIVIVDALAGLTLGKRIPYMARVLCGVLLGAAASYAVLSLLGVRWKEIDESCLASIQIPTRGLGGVDPQVLAHVTKESLGDWYWAWLQWAAYRGPYLSAIIPLALVAVWQWLRAGGWKDEAGVLDLGSRRTRWRTTFGAVRTSAVTAALVFLVLYVAVVPTCLRAIEDDFQAKMAFYRDPQAWWENVHSTMATMEAESREAPQ
jgi:hypothetical protein